jgi:2-polyprenyl-3-methyl-5-hydroxy-6-metoxy-1,4-benzoquinol methylase
MKSPIEVFTKWADEGRDEAMAKGHANSVNAMLDFAYKDLKDTFTFIDSGCGNGWVVRMVGKHPLCNKAIGVDGSRSMINKSTSMDTNNIYECASLLDWVPDEKADLVLSMEVFYYVNDPIKLINHVVKNWLKPLGRLIIGIDYYKENKASESWPLDCGISIMTRLSEKEWTEGFIKSGLANVLTWREGQKDNWAGTLILTGKKPRD